MSDEQREIDPCVHCGADEGHRNDCPTLTNMWPVTASASVQCHICKNWMFSGYYRLLPTLPEDNDLADLNMPFWWEEGTKIACANCAAFKVIINEAYRSPIQKPLPPA